MMMMMAAVVVVRCFFPGVVHGAGVDSSVCRGLFDAPGAVTERRPRPDAVEATFQVGHVPSFFYILVVFFSGAGGRSGFGWWHNRRGANWIGDGMGRRFGCPGIRVTNVAVGGTGGLLPGKLGKTAAADLWWRPVGFYWPFTRCGGGGGRFSARFERRTGRCSTLCCFWCRHRLAWPVWLRGIFRCFVVVVVVFVASFVRDWFRVGRGVFEGSKRRHRHLTALVAYCRRRRRRSSAGLCGSGRDADRDRRSSYPSRPFPFRRRCPFFPFFLSLSLFTAAALMGASELREVVKRAR